MNQQSIFRREFEILTTQAGWSVDEAIEFLSNAAKGGATTISRPQTSPGATAVASGVFSARQSR